MISTKILSLLIFIFSLNAFSGLKDVYKFRWLDKKKKVFVLQDKMHENAKRFYISVGYGPGKLSEFQATSTLNATAGYYFSEEWAFEAFYNHGLNSNNGAYDAVVRQTSGGTGGRTVLPHVQRYNNQIGGYLLWSPFYGKINTFNLIFYVDLSFGLGVSMNNYSHNTNATIQSGQSGTTQILDSYEDDSAISLNAKFQFMWHMTRHWKFKFDYANYFASIQSLDFQGAGKGHKKADEIIGAHDLLFSIGYMF